MKVAVRRLPSKGHNTPQTPTHMCTHHQQSWASFVSARADECGQAREMHDAFQADFAWQLPFSRLASDIALPPPTSRQFPSSPTAMRHGDLCHMLAHGCAATGCWRHAPYGHGEVWPCPGANASRGPRSAPGRTSGVESRNHLRKQRRMKVSERKTAPIWRIRVPKHL